MWGKSTFYLTKPILAGSHRHTGNGKIFIYDVKPNAPDTDR